jgi:hypothetical protein
MAKIKIGDKVCTCLKGKEKQFPDLLSESPEDFECGHPKNVGIVSSVTKSGYYLDFPFYGSHAGEFMKDEVHRIYKSRKRRGR